MVKQKISLVAVLQPIQILPTFSSYIQAILRFFEKEEVSRKSFFLPFEISLVSFCLLLVVVFYFCLVMLRQSKQRLSPTSKWPSPDSKLKAWSNPSSES